MINRCAINLLIDSSHCRSLHLLENLSSRLYIEFRRDVNLSRRCGAICRTRPAKKIIISRRRSTNSTALLYVAPGCIRFSFPLPLISNQTVRIRTSTDLIVEMSRFVSGRLSIAQLVAEVQ